MSMMQYDGYIAKVEYDDKIEMFSGMVINTSDVITFYGKSVRDLKREFVNSLKAHFEFCQKKGMEPSKPFSGRITVRITPELHRLILSAAADEEKSLNAWITESLNHELQLAA